MAKGFIFAETFQIKPARGIGNGRGEAISLWTTMCECQTEPKKWYEDLRRIQGWWKGLEHWRKMLGKSHANRR